MIGTVTFEVIKEFSDLTYNMSRYITMVSEENFEENEDYFERACCGKNGWRWRYWNKWHSEDDSEDASIDE